MEDHSGGQRGDRMEDHSGGQMGGRSEDHLEDRMGGQMGGRSEDQRVAHWADHSGGRTVVSGLPWEERVVGMMLVVPRVLLGLLSTASGAREEGQRRVRTLVVLLQQGA